MYFKMLSAENFTQHAKGNITFLAEKVLYSELSMNKYFSANQGPVVQSVVSLTSSLRVISLTVLVDSIYNILIFFQQIISAYLHITGCKF